MSLIDKNFPYRIDWEIKFVGNKMRACAATYTILLLAFGSFLSGECIRCYECVARLGPGETSACLYGDEVQLRRVHCIGPSVCAAYHYQTVIPGTPTVNHITRGCQALRYGATCEDIFNELRMRNEILPGQHTCTTCSTDLCNSSSKVKTIPLGFSVMCAFIYKFMLV